MGGSQSGGRFIGNIHYYKSTTSGDKIADWSFYAYDVSGWSRTSRWQVLADLDGSNNALGYMKFFVNTNDLLLTLTKDQAVQITGTGTEPACATANTAVLAYNTTVNLLCYCLNGSGTWKDIKDGISACGTW